VTQRAPTRPRKASRWFFRLTVFIVALIALASFGAAGGVLWLRHAMRQQLPQMDGQIKLAGLQAAVTVRRDEHDIPHIDAANLDDLFTAQGYITAQDRLWQMDITRRFAAGDLAEIFGNSIFGSGPLRHDRLQRVLLFRRTAERITAALSPTERRYFDDYARGVNAYIAESSHPLPAEFRVLHYQPKPWAAVDSVLVGISLVQMLDESWPTKLARLQVEQALIKKVGPDRAASMIADLYPTGSWRDHPPTQAPPDPSHPPLPAAEVPLDESQSLLEDLLQLRKIEGKQDSCLTCISGSNEWAVAGQHTASGKPLLSNDMHLNHTLPDIWYQADLQAGDFHVTGVTPPGLPFIVEGHNAHIAWGYTALYGDVQDLYVEKVNDQHEYWKGNAWQPMQRVQETIPVRWSKEESIEVDSTDHGPILDPVLPNDQRTLEQAGQALALKWTIYDPSLNGLPIFELDSAANWSDFQKAASVWCWPTQNLIYADDQGHIGYQSVGRMPLRPGGLAPVPITDTNHEWQGYIPFTAMPSIEDPASGILATANSRITPDGYAYPLTLEWASPYRNERIWKWLTGKEQLTPADMLKLQTDIYSEVDQELAQRFTYAIDHASHPSSRLRQAADLLRGWDGRLTTNSAAPAILSAAKGAWWPLVLQPQIGAAWHIYEWPESAFVQEQLITNQPSAWLPPGYKSWNDLLAAAVDAGLNDAHAPADLKQWQYGQQHVLQVTHPLYGSLPFFKWTGVGPTPQSGDTSTVKQVGTSFGPSQRFTMDWSNIDGSTENIFSGEAGDPLSEHYADQFYYWYNGKTFALPFTPQAVAAQTAHTLQLTPLLKASPSPAPAHLAQMRFFRRRKRSLLVQLLHLLRRRIFRLAHRLVFRQNVSMLIIDPLNGHRRRRRNTRKAQFHLLGRPMLVRINQVPGGNRQGTVSIPGHDHVL
jgi:penicillin amidase